MIFIKKILKPKINNHEITAFNLLFVDVKNLEMLSNQITNYIHNFISIGNI